MPYPLTSALTRIRTDPPFIPSSPTYLESSLSSSLVDEWQLNPLLISQIKSMRPESMGYLYCDFFSSSQNQICRIAKSRTDSAFNYIWSADYWGWFNPPIHYCDAVVDKLFRDKGHGTIFYPLDLRKYSSLLHSFASIIFTFVHSSVDSSQMAAFIIDSTVIQPQLQLLSRFRSIQIFLPLLNTLHPLSKLMPGYMLSVYIQTILSFIELLMVLFGDEV